MAKIASKSHTVLVTGATDGIGLQLALAYAKRGHRILATGRQSFVKNDAFAENPNIKYIRADQERPKQAAQNIAHAMRELGWTQLDLAILNAGIGWTGDPAEESSAQIEQQVRVNLLASIFISKAVAPWLFVEQGTLTLIGSTAIKGQRAFATYSATKAGLDGFARSLREEWRGRASVVMVHPGPVRTQMHKKAGLKIGMARMFFMSPKRASACIQKAIRRSDKRRFITKRYGWRSWFSGVRKGQL